jgi:hypothetical protein
MSRLLLSAALLLTIASFTARADLDPEVKQPYQFRVALRVAPHRNLTTVFKDALQHDLQDILQNALGALAQVEIVDLANQRVVEQDPLLVKVLEKGLQEGLEGPQPVTGVKTHFLTVDFVSGRYQLQARQHDGLTGLSSPLVRRDWTDDRLLVARSAALLIGKDFGLVGTFDKVDGAKVSVQIRGGVCGASLRPWVKKEDVFAVAVIQRGGRTGLQSLRLPWTLLRVLEEPKGAECVCQIFNRNHWGGSPVPQGPGILGYRCIKIGTTHGSPRLRFVAVDDKTGAALPGSPVAGLQINVSPAGFEAKAREARATNSDGFVAFKEDYNNAAFVRVLSNSGQLVAQLPIEIVSDRVILCPVSTNPEAEQRGQLQLRLSRWVQRLNESLLEESTLVRDLNAKADQARKEALTRALAGVESLRAAIESGESARVHLKAEANAAGVPLDFKEGEQRLQELRARRERLEKYAKNLEEIEQKAADPKTKALLTQAEQASQLEEQAEYGQAIELYKKLIAEGAEDPRVKERLETLVEQWKVKSKEHERARTFIYETWAKLQEPDALKEKLVDLQEAFRICRDVADFLTLHKLLKTCNDHILKLAKLRDTLQPNNDDDERRLKVIVDVLENVDKIINQATDYLRTAKAVGK